MRTIRGLLIDMATFYNYDLGERQMALFDRLLSRYNVDMVFEAAERYMANPRHSKFPVPPTQILLDSVTEADEAKEVAARITAALSKYGYTNSFAARNFIGELGWQVVLMQGGWSALCERVKQSELPTYQAQWRDLAVSLKHKFESGKQATKPSLPGQSHVELLQ